MTFVKSIKTCFRKYFVFRGRASRSEFWWFQLLILILTIAAPTLDVIVFGYNWIENAFTPFAMSLTVVTLFPYATVTARRLHDLGCSGWWQLPIYGGYILYLDPFVPEISTGLGGSIVAVSVVSSLLLLGFFIKDGQVQTNRYGPNPKSPNMGEVFN